MATTQSSQLRTIRRKVISLQRRLSLLERAIRPKETVAERESSSVAAADTRWEEIQARVKAMEEYNELQFLELYRRHPSLLEEDLQNERKRNAFLRERGISRIDDMVTRIAKQLANDSTR